MLNFKDLTLSDINTIKSFLQLQQSRICDLTVGGIFMWRDYFRTQFTIYQNTLIFKVRYLNGEVAFPVPLGKNPSAALEQIELYCKQNELPVVYCTVPQNSLPMFQQRYPKASIQPSRDWFDYLYHTEDLLAFKGKKYDGQRNHINKFKKACPDYTFEEIGKENLGKVRLFYDHFAEEYEKASDLAKEESAKVKELLEHYEQYGLFGGFISFEDEIISLSIGERINDTIYVHVEKADINYPGAYQITVQEFLKHFVRDGDLYVNREEDVGDAGLRKSKLSYHPVELLEKSTVCANI